MDQGRLLEEQLLRPQLYFLKLAVHDPAQASADIVIRSILLPGFVDGDEGGFTIILQIQLMLVDRCIAPLGLNRAHNIEARVQNLGNPTGIANVVIACEVAQVISAIMRAYVKVVGWPGALGSISVAVHVSDGSHCPTLLFHWRAPLVFTSPTALQ